MTASDANAVALLRNARTIAVLGAHWDLERPAGYVPDYLFRNGYRVLPVNPCFVGQTWWSEPVRATLAELDQAVDIVNVFRKSSDIMAHCPDILAMLPRPGCVWLQLGIVQDELGPPLWAAVIALVQDRCTLADHLRHGLPKIVAHR